MQLNIEIKLLHLMFDSEFCLQIIIFKYRVKVQLAVLEVWSFLRLFCFIPLQSFFHQKLFQIDLK